MDDIFAKIIKEVETNQVKFQTLEHFMKEPISDVKWVVDRLVPEGTTTMLSGFAGTFKTFLSMSIATSVASGKKAFNHFYTEKGPVCIVNEENPRRQVQSRFRSLSKVIDLPITLFLRQGLRLDKKESIDNLIEHVVKQNTRLLILDNLTQLHEMNENSSEMSRVMRALIPITDTGCSVLMIHHHRKPGGMGLGGNDLSHSLRGSTAIFGALASSLVVELKKEDNEKFLIFTQTKCWDDELYPPFKVKIQTSEDSIEFIYDGEYDKNRLKLEKAMERIPTLLEQSDGPQTRKEIVEAIGIGDNNTRDALKKLIELGEVCEGIGSKHGRDDYPRSKVYFAKNSWDSLSSNSMK